MVVPVVSWPAKSWCRFFCPGKKKVRFSSFFLFLFFDFFSKNGNAALLSHLRQDLVPQLLSRGLSSCLRVDRRKHQRERVLALLIVVLFLFLVAVSVGRRGGGGGRTRRRRARAHRFLNDSVDPLEHSLPRLEGAPEFREPAEVVRQREGALLLKTVFEKKERRKKGEFFTFSKR